MPPLTAKHRVVVTGFGPFRNFTINPSWLAAQRLHNSVTFTKSGELIQITSVQVPVTYTDVLEIVPGLHSSPPVLPDEFADREPLHSEGDYTLIVHIGVAGAGPLRFETVAHKTGYGMPDTTNRMAAIVDASTVPPLRGFAHEKYTSLPEVLTTNVDATSIVAKLAGQSVKIRTSVDAGHFLCDYIYYCSLAEAKLTGKETPVLFIHCPPVDQPLSTAQVADAVARVIMEACSQSRKV